MVEEGELERVQKEKRLVYAKLVLEKLVINYAKVGNEVKKSMGVMLIKTEYDIAEGEKHGRKNALVDSIKNAMESFHVSLQEAMDGLKIPKEEQDTYAKLIKKEQ